MISQHDEPEKTFISKTLAQMIFIIMHQISLTKKNNMENPVVSTCIVLKFGYSVNTTVSAANQFILTISILSTVIQSNSIYFRM